MTVLAEVPGAWLLRFTRGQNHEARGFSVNTSLAESDRPRPALYQCCGTEDFLYDDNIRFRDHAKSIGLEVTYDEGPGEHEWGYWDREIQNVLQWLPLNR